MSEINFMFSAIQFRTLNNNVLRIKKKYTSLNVINYTQIYNYIFVLCDYYHLSYKLDIAGELFAKSIS